MTKKAFLTLVSTVLLVFMLIGCGSDKKKEAEKPDTGDTEAVTNTDPAETGDTETLPDTDPTEIEDNDPGNVTQDRCTIKSSFGTHSAKRDVADTCIKEIAKADGAQCTWKRKDESETARYIARLQRLKITFGDECKDKSGEQTVECPDFIPESLNLIKLTGCDVYSIDPNSLCLAPCADIYFSTDNDIFYSVYVGDEYGEYPFIKSSDSIEEASFLTYMIDGMDYALFSWSEKGTDGTETEKEVWVFRKIVDPATGEGEEEEVPDDDTILAQCEDSEGRIYKKGDLISEKCGALICSENGWDIYYDTECDIECDPNGGIVEIRYWDCSDGTEFEWCFCDEDENQNTKLNCIERIDLQCPTE